eukprot:10465228-Alexandrium_andersonii.AAC.1
MQTWDGTLDPQTLEVLQDPRHKREDSKGDRWASKLDKGELCITRAMVKTVLRESSKKKAPGVDELPYEVLLALPEE